MVYESALELNEPRLRPGLNHIITPNAYFNQLFPVQTQQFGPAFLQVLETNLTSKCKINPVSINIDFFASILSDPRIGLSVVYYEPEMQFYFNSPFQPIYKLVSPEKLQNLYRGILIQATKCLDNSVNILNLFMEFRSDKVAKQVVNRAKSVLAADSSYFSAQSKYQRVRGIELCERVARKFVEEVLSAEPGQILRLGDAYEVFRRLLKDRELPDMNRPDFRAVVAPLITEQFNVCLRNDLGGAGGRGWKGVKLQSLPGLN